MNKVVAISFLLLSALLINGCYYDVAEELYPDTGGAACDTSNVTYSLTVKPIIDQYCISCHSQAAQQGGVILEGYTSLLGYANSGQLLGAIKHETGFAPMPQGSAKMTDCNILKIEKWVISGSPNN